MNRSIQRHIMSSRLLPGLFHQARKRFHLNSKLARRQRRLTLEYLECRQLLTLIGIIPSFPLIKFNSNGTVQYTAATHVFDVNATPLTFQLNASTAPASITGPAHVEIDALIDNSGDLIGGNGQPNDFDMTGTIVVNGSTYSGTLLTGKILQFGFQFNSGTSTGQFDFRFQFTGGTLQPFFVGIDIGVTTASANLTPSTGSFATGFSGGAKGTVGPTGLQSAIVIANNKSPVTPHTVDIINPENGSPILSSPIVPYGSTFLGGVRVATGDLNGNGSDDIVTVPGPGGLPVVNVYGQGGGLLTSFQAYNSSVNGGLQVAVADLYGNGLDDVVTVPSWGPAEVRVFKNLGVVGGTPVFSSTPSMDFLAFPSSFVGGAVVAAANLGTMPNEMPQIIVGSGSGMKATVAVFNVSNTPPASQPVLATPVASFAPFNTISPPLVGGVSLSVAQLTASPIQDIVVGAGAGGQSLVNIWGWNTTQSAYASLSNSSIAGFPAFSGSNKNAPIDIATRDNSQGIASAILAVQSSGGTTKQVSQLNILGVSPLVLSSPTVIPIPLSYSGPDTIAVINEVASGTPAAKRLAPTSTSPTMSAAAVLTSNTPNKNRTTAVTSLPDSYFALLGS